MDEKRISQGRMVALLLFGIAMAFLEAAVVVYLRKIFYPEGFFIPLKLKFPYLTFTTSIPFGPNWGELYVVELGREAATIMMLVSVSFLTVRRFLYRWGVFLFIFGIWDIFYYFFLYLLLGWPPSPLTLDVLFLIPVPWVAPVLLPLSISVIMVVIGIFILK